MNDLNFEKKFRVRFRIYKMKFLEFVRFDSTIASACLFAIYLGKYLVMRMVKGKIRALIIAGDIFRHTQIPWVREFATKKLMDVIRELGSRKVGQEIFNIVREKIDPDVKERLRHSFFIKPLRPFDQRFLILSPPSREEKGVMIVKFSDYFKYFADIFDIAAISMDYVLIAEPSSVGLFDLDLLCLMSEDLVVVVESQEPVDAKFLNKLSANFHPTDLGSNLWVDQKAFFPLKDTNKKYDVVMIALFADVKRHYHLFEAIKKCKKNISVVLVGVAWPKSLEEIKDEARYFGVLDSITFLEKISQQEVNKVLNESKVFLLLSKKEGSNKASIESMFAGTPVFYLEGYNYGHHYSFINPKTGGFIEHRFLAEFLDNIGNLIRENIYNPHDYVKMHCTPERSTAKLIKFLRDIEEKCSIKVNKELVVKINNPNLDYFDSDNWSILKPYYEGMKSYMKSTNV